MTLEQEHGLRQSPRNKEALRNQFFEQLVIEKLLDRFLEDFAEAGLSEKNIRELITSFAALPEKDKGAALAVPAQLRLQRFEKYAEDMEGGKVTAQDVLKDLVTKANKYGFILAYHLSPKEIKPKKDGEWVVEGREKDHRHNDVPMAYYSLDYTNRYLKKPVQYLYVVRAETKDESGHYRDNDGTWGHAPTLSIIDVIDMRELEKDLETRLASL